MLLIYCLLLSIISSYYGVHSQATSITLLNSTNAFCEQDVVQFNCTFLAVMNYKDSRASLSINGSSCVSPFVVNVNVPRVTFTDIGASFITPSALYTVYPYLVQDSATQYRCCARFNPNFEFTNSLTLLLAAVPSSASVIISTTYNSATSCNGTITLTWLAVASDRAVTSYKILLDGTYITTLSPTAGTNTYTTSSMSLATFNGSYIVRSVSCAGSSVSNEVVFTPPTPPSAANISISATYVSATSCNGTLTLTWLAVASDRAVTSYEVLQYGANLATLSPTAGTNTISTGSIPLDKFTIILRYTVRAVSCAGSSVSNEVVFTLLNPPNSFLFSHVFTNLSNCEASLSISAPTIISDRPLTHYNLFINNKLVHTLPANGNSYSFSGNISFDQININITVTAYSCVGATSYSAFETASCVKPTTSTPTISTTSTTVTLSTNSSPTTTPSSTTPPTTASPTISTTSTTVTLSTNSSPTTTPSSTSTPTISTTTTATVTLSTNSSSTTLLSSTTPVILPFSCTDCSTADMFITNTTQSYLTTSGTSEQSSNSTFYIAVIVILAALLLLAIIIIVIMSICIIYLLRKSKNNSSNDNADPPADIPTDTTYNYYDSPQTTDTQYYYTELNNNGNNIPEGVNTNTTTNTNTNNNNIPTDTVHMYNYIEFNDSPQTTNTQYYYTELNNIATNNNNNNNNIPTDTVHTYTYIDVNDSPQTTNTQHYYTELNNIATNNNNNNIPTDTVHTYTYIDVNDIPQTH